MKGLRPVHRTPALKSVGPRRLKGRVINLLRRDRRTHLVAAALMGCVLVLSACGGAATPAGPATSAKAPAGTTTAAGQHAVGSLPSTLTIALSGDFTTLDGAIRVDTNDRILYSNIYDSLITRNPSTGQLEPRLAVSWKQTSPLTWVFNIRKGVKFQNGDPLTAADVAWSLNRTQNPAISQAAGSDHYGKVTATGPYTVQITTPYVDPLLLTRVTDTAYIGDEAYYKKVGASVFGQKPVGTGPYEFVAWVKGSHLTLKANPHYWGGSVPIKNLTFDIIPNSTTRVAALLSGQVDLATSIPPSLVPRLQSSSSVRVTEATNPMSVGVWFKMNTKPFNNQLVRQALNYAVNKQAIVKNLWDGQATVLNGPIFPGAFGYNPNLKPYSYDPAKAKQLLTEAGYPSGFTFTEDVPIGGIPLASEVSQAVASDLAKVGVTMKLKQIEFAAFLKKLFTPKSEAMDPAFFLYVKSPSLDGDGVLSYSFLCKGTYPNGANWDNYCDPAVEKQMDQEARSTNSTLRKTVMQQVDGEIRNQAPWIFLYSPKSIYGVRKGLSWTPRIDGLIPVWDSFKTK